MLKSTNNESNNSIWEIHQKKNHQKNSVWETNFHVKLTNSFVFKLHDFVSYYFIVVLKQ